MANPEAAEELEFISMPGVGLVFQPGCSASPEHKKHPCPDCRFCQFCAETRCVTCRSGKGRGKSATCRKMSLQEQVLFYEELNACAHDAE